MLLRQGVGQAAFCHRDFCHGCQYASKRFADDFAKYRLRFQYEKGQSKYVTRFQPLTGIFRDDLVEYRELGPD